jgi:hypothetical protein
VTKKTDIQNPQVSFWGEKLCKWTASRIEFCHEFCSSIPRRKNLKKAV